MIKFDIAHIEEDEQSEAISKEILKLKALGLQHNIDFAKAEEERIELEAKLNKSSTTKSKPTLTKNNKNETVLNLKDNKNEENSLNF